MTEGKGEITIYQEQDGSPNIEVTLDGETLWLSHRRKVENHPGILVKAAKSDSNWFDNLPLQVRPCPDF